MIILFAFYVGIGIFLNMRNNNLSGKEAIPHIEFWRTFPELVQEGMIYTLNSAKNGVYFVKSKIKKENTAYNEL